MNGESVAIQVLDTIRQHLPAGADWAPLATLGGAVVIGLLFMIRGARLAPALCAIFFLGVGCAAGPLVAAQANLPWLPTLIVLGTLGLVIGIVMFRLWFAVLVAGSLAVTSLAFYSAQTLLPLAESFSVRGLEAGESGLVVTLPDAPTDEARLVSWLPISAAFVDHVRTAQPNLGMNVLAITLAAGVAGLVFALLLPKTSRAVWAATMGTLVFVPAIYFLFALIWRDGAEWMGRYPLVIGAALWSASLLINLADLLEWRMKRRPPAAEPA